jgi:hypothetical protein
MTTVIKPNIEIPENRQLELDEIFNITHVKETIPIQENKV